MTQGAEDAGVVALVDAMFTDEARFGTTYAVVVARRGEVIAERYGGRLPSRSGAGPAVGPDTALLSWSIAKSVLHAAVGVLVGAGALDPDAPAAVPEWRHVGDPRRDITLEHLLCMRDGLDFVEDYVDEGRSDVIEMLFGAGRTDVAHFAAQRPLAHPPGTVFNYSSGSSNIVAGLLARVVGSGPATVEFLRDAVFGPIGMDSARVRGDDAGTFVASSFVYATARDWVRFGECYAHDGVAGGRRVVPDGWVGHGVRPRSVDPDTGWRHGAHWWVLDGVAEPTFFANGYDGQRLLVSPGPGLVVARFGRSPVVHSPVVHRDALQEWCRAVVVAGAAGSTFRS